MRFLRWLVRLGLLVGATGACIGQESEHTVAWPDALVTHAHQSVGSAAEFVAVRRPELLRDFEENVFGRTPSQAAAMQGVTVQTRVTSVDAHALNGLAVRKQIAITLTKGSRSRALHLLVYLPAKHAAPVPVFVGLNFDGNETISTDPGIDLNDLWIPDPSLVGVAMADELKGHVVRRAEEASRGKAAGRWQVEEILRDGFGLATVYAGDIEPDFAAGIGYGVRPMFFHQGQGLPDADDWGAIGAWAWGMSRIADYLLTDVSVDAHGLIAFGFSRFGKAALWAGAQDERFSVVISHESGQGGATLAHREVDEPLAHLNLAFPYWFCGNYHHFTGRTQELPVDGHLLLALIAPRPLYVGSAHEDPFSDPEGEFLAAKAVTPVYALFGKAGLPLDAQYVVNRPIGKDLRYYVRPGGHDVLPEDWQQYIAFAREQLAHGR